MSAGFTPTFDPDLICVGYDDDVPVFVRRDSPEGQVAVEREREAAAKERIRDAAPELYEACAEAILRCSMSDSMRRQLHAALAKARGEQA